MCALATSPVSGPARVRYRVVVRWEWWAAADEGGPRSEVVAECETAGQLLGLLREWNRAPGVATLTYESRGADGGWRREGRAA